MKRSHEPRTGALHDFELHLKESGKTPTTVCNYARLVRQFLKFVGNESPERISEDLVRAFFNGIANCKTKREYATRIGQFLKFTAAHLPVTGKLASAMPPGPAAKEVAIRQRWSLDHLINQKEKDADSIAQLARKIIDHYLYFQARLKADPKTLMRCIASPTNAGN